MSAKDFELPKSDDVSVEETAIENSDEGSGNEELREKTKKTKTKTKEMKTKTTTTTTKLKTMKMRR